MPKSPFHIASKSIDDHTVTAAGTISIGCCVGYDHLQVSSAGAAVRGIAKSNAITGQDLNVATNGTAPARVGAAVVVGAALTPDAQGRLVTATTGQLILARALQAAANADEFIGIFFTREGKA